MIKFIRCKKCHIHVQRNNQSAFSSLMQLLASLRSSNKLTREYLPILVTIIVSIYTERDVDSYASFINVITKKKNLYSVFFAEISFTIK
jgi:hypothetical protein